MSGSGRPRWLLRKPLGHLFLRARGRWSPFRFLLLLLLPAWAGWGTWRRVMPSERPPPAPLLQHPPLPAAYAELRSPVPDLPERARKDALREGTILYQKNCRPCHGAKGDGAGPLSRGLRLPPANFTDPRTIATLPEAYLLWRIRQGALGFSRPATAAESAMPSWKGELTDEQMWKIIAAEHAIRNRKPRVLRRRAAPALRWLDLRVPAPPTMDSATAAAGQQVYEQHCWFCHGEKGDGSGPVAPYLWPRPRDFTAGSYELRTTESGELPTDEDLYRTLTLGIPGTSMPEWGSLLTPAERWQVISFIKGFAADLFEDEGLDPARYTIRADRPPEEPTEDWIAQGRRSFEEAGCWECHGRQGRGDGRRGRELSDDRGFPVPPTNLHWAGKFKGGQTTRDIYLRLTGGLNGTPMPSYKESLTDLERWKLAYYVASLNQTPEVDPSPHFVITARLTEAGLPITADDSAWTTTPATHIILTGQATYPPRWQIPGVTDLEARALYNTRGVALWLAWDDRFADTLPVDPALALREGWHADDTYPALYPTGRRARGSFPDGVEIVLPYHSEAHSSLPHFVYGNPDSPVDLWRWRADMEGNGAEGPVREFRATGGSEPPVLRSPRDQLATGSGAWRDGRWRVVIRRPLVTREAGSEAQLHPGQLLPIAFHVWEGSNGETGLRMAISSWYFLRLQERVSVRDYLAVLLTALAVAGLELGLFLSLGKLARTDRPTREGPAGD